MSTQLPKTEIKKMNFKIEKVTCFVAVDTDSGDEGIMGFKAAGGWMPLVCADEARIAQMFAAAEHIKAVTGCDYRVIQFDNRVDVTQETKNKYSHIEEEF